MLIYISSVKVYRLTSAATTNWKERTCTASSGTVTMWSFIGDPDLSCQAQVQVLKPKSQIQSQSLKSKVQSSEERDWDWADTIILQATTTTHNFSNLKCQSHDWKRSSWPSLTFLDLPWHSMTFHDHQWPSLIFYHLQRPLWHSMIKCLVSRPGLISGPLKPKPKLNLTQFQGLTLSTPSLDFYFKFPSVLLKGSGEIFPKEPN